ncbi:MAG: stress response translation initiation inhibitor YciH [Zetaproteobacteria bacterium]|nr:MAG: stress response translation initiation inhibitor YciH [Zetaproteobacteria bacterium]
MEDRVLVYSTETGRVARKRRRKVDAAPAAVPGGGVVVRREKKGRGGKEVTVVLGLRAAPDALKAQAKRLKAAIGSGGTVKNGTIEIQGDHCARVIALLAEEGIEARRGGG